MNLNREIEDRTFYAGTFCVSIYLAKDSLKINWRFIFGLVRYGTRLPPSIEIYEKNINGALVYSI